LPKRLQRNSNQKEKAFAQKLASRFVMGAGAFRTSLREYFSLVKIVRSQAWLFHKCLSTQTGLRQLHKYLVFYFPIPVFFSFISFGFTLARLFCEPTVAQGRAGALDRGEEN
jgi:hypothetical protein